MRPAGFWSRLVGSPSSRGRWTSSCRTACGPTWSAALAGRLARRPVVLEIYDRVAPGLGRRLLRLAVRWAAHSVACSEAVAECAGPTVRGRISVVHLTVDTDRFTPGPADPEVRAQLGAEADEPLVGILGRWDPEKGIDLLVEAMTRLGDDLGDTRLAVVGAVHGASQEFGRQLRERAAAALGPRVRFVPPRRDVPAVLRSLDVLVNASKAEPFGLTVLEAQACGIPVIGTRSGGIPEFVTDGETGLLVSPGDPEAMARALRRVISDPMLRARLATNARRRVDRFNRDARRADVLAGLYRKVLRS
ncbi:MAG: glycosyltransferase family 4 protein [Acidimicrobiia bacterium]|nr:glycosyltransferase family 4 protein [Acidimicrobiia bacterium]